MDDNTKGTCPLGGRWYICTDQSPTFFGCCTIDPCGGDNTGCPASNLRAAGMGTDGGPDGMSSNDGSYWPNVQCPSGQWWTCAKQTPSFQGCCDINPCQGAMSCPVASLHAAAFQTIPAELGAAATTMVLTTLTSALAASARSSSSSQSTITDSTIQAAAVTPSSPTTSSISTATPPALANGDPLPKPSTSSNIGAIAGGAAGGLALLIAILLAIWVCRRKRCKTSVPVHHEPHMTFASAGQNEVSNSNYEEFAPATGPDKAQIQPHNAEAYYPGQSIYSVPHATKYAPVPSASPPLSPGPPPYASAHPSPNPNVHEIDSAGVYEPGGNSMAGTYPYRGVDRPVGGGVGSVAELPTVQAGDESRWRARKPTGMQNVELGEGSPRVVESGPVSGESGESVGRGSPPGQGRDARQSYVSWQTLSP